MLNLLILLLILINIALCSYGLYKKVNESYMDGSDYAKELMNQFKESQKSEGYELDSDRLVNKFSGEGETYEDTQDIVKSNLSNLYGQ
jgi:hypothetical protein